ncbi:60S acidic ribosomal protein P2B-like [Panicum virgatum]|uniref:Uncharacterized protein n=1 Tax=Panicum virgatum TaxID=38727 RepID=A0A8T0W0Q7_PANVG|nr:60S acidic ribosomal protein P2B-like [Panicum virgatum]KAG2640970.1 hypothetical protein PVAP13_2KG133800 [Panicum virgatum]
MKFVAAYLLACLGAAAAAAEGAPARPTKEDVRRILGSVGADAGEEEEGRLDLLFARLEGKDVAELVAAGREQLAYGAAAPAAVAAAPAAADAKEAKEEEKKEEDEEEEEEEMFSLFDDM